MMFAEHHFEIEGYHVTPNPLMLNVYLAQHTKRLRQGQMGLVLPNWNPLRLAEDIAMADHLTGGRLDIGLSRGYQPRSVGVMGHVWTAPAVQEESDLSAKRSGAAMYAACFSRRGLPRRDAAAVAAGPDVIR